MSEVSSFSLPNYSMNSSANFMGLSDPGSIAPTFGSMQMPSTMGLPDFGRSGGMPGMLGKQGVGIMPKLGLGLAGLQTIGGLWAAFQQQKLAKESFRFNKGLTETNLANQIKSYNTTLSDRGRSRAVVEGQSAAQAQDYIDKNKMTKGF